MMLKWDADSTFSFKADGQYVRDYDARFQLEDEGFIKPTDRWRWDYLKHPPCPQLSLFDGGEYD